MESKLEKLRELGELKVSGAITSEEFELLKYELLNVKGLSDIKGDQSRDGAATAGMVLGVISLLAWIIPLIGAPISIIGLVQSNKGLKSNIKGQATAGLILNIIGLFATIINASIGAYKGMNGLL